MATELSRVASAAMRSIPAFGRGNASRTRTPASSSFLFGSPAAYTRPASASSITCALRSLGINSSRVDGPAAVAGQKRQATDWASPGRAARPSFGSNNDNNSNNNTNPPTTRPSISGFGSNRFAGRSLGADAEPTYSVPSLGSALVPDDMTFSAGELSKGGYGDDEDPLRPKRNLIRCVPRTGRTTYVSKGADVSRAFKLTEIQCYTNRVRMDSNKQRFHERPGLKRKRLKSERWQRKFKAGFKATCARVQELRKQGW